MNQVVLIMVTLFTISALAIILLLYFIQSKKNRHLKEVLEKLEVEKNIIDSSPIVPELDKIQKLKKNEKLDLLWKDWSERLDSIKNIQIPKITDMLLEADHSLSKMDYRTTMYDIAKLEMEIYKVRTNSEFLLNEIKEITDSEEKNRTIVTALKSRYRELYQKFLDSQNEFGTLNKAVALQFENISKRFEDFEIIMEQNEYTEVKALIGAIEEMIKHMDVVTEELPTIVLLATNLLPKRMKEITDTYTGLVRNGYPLDYLNVEYNIEEASKKISDIMDRAGILNLEDSLLELKVLNDYFDSLDTDFEKEKVARHAYEEGDKVFVIKIKKITKLVNDIFKQIDEIKSLYDLSAEDATILTQIRDSIEELNTDYKVLKDHTGNAAFAYSKLIKEMEGLNARLSTTEENLDHYLDTIGSMKDDESRARQQLEEVKVILKDAKLRLREYNLPIIPKSYYTELKEAGDALKEIVRELEKKPISIGVLNTRVDTARDLALKLFSKTQTMLRMARFAETAIVYGNRYRSIVEDLDKHLTYAESLYFKGEYQKSLETTINALNKVEPGIYEKLTGLYEEKQQAA
ncbi:MAG: septation ring formation regulator EzrA [Bacilli bacterium]|nr:septation ring formation regulator EzrA [Bacilli bacterium]